MGIATEGTELDTLLFLVGPVLLVPVGCLSLERAVEGVGNVDVSAWPWEWRFNFLVDIPLVTAVERSVDRLLHHDSVLDVVLLLLVVVLARAWVLDVGLLGVGRLDLVPPEVGPLGLGQEGLRLLADELPIVVLLGIVYYLSLN